MSHAEQQPLPASASILDDPRWAALKRRGQGADGSFFYAVKTTGVYCRPSCAARMPRPENVMFYATRAEAEAAGFRPCLRCKPDLPPAAERTAALVARMCRLLETCDSPPTLEQLAEHVGLSAFHAHRLFKAGTGVTPRGYFAAQRGQRVRAELRRPGNVTAAIYGAGYGSAGRFYEEADARLGMTPSAFKAGGADMRIRFASGACSLGALLVAGTARGICAISLGDDEGELLRDLRRQFPRAELIAADAELAQLLVQVVALVEQPSRPHELPLDIRGTAFQERVWQALRGLRPGEHVSYRELAARIGQPHAVLAVANACAQNRLAVAVPCHRVLRSDGKLSGYRWGVARKRQLLEREREP
jgi:AraC family transcriptional regulator, regulatory protein of adaptative response / methylated-DNA-[protein]-cysteine methyltransferase